MFNTSLAVERESKRFLLFCLQYIQMGKCFLAFFRPSIIVILRLLFHFVDDVMDDVVDVLVEDDRRRRHGIGLLLLLLLLLLIPATTTTKSPLKESHNAPALFR